MSFPTQRSRVAAYGVATQDDRILLTRASERSDVPGTWWFPGGGLEFGEHPAEAVVRELAEETGLQARVVRLIDVVSTVANRPPPFDGEQLHTLRFIYEVEVIGGELTSETDESSDLAAWVAVSDVRDLPLMPFFDAFVPRNPAL